MLDKPSIITTRKLLPFDALEPLEFERLSLWLIEREGYLRPQHLGAAGNEQGRDVVAYKKGEAGEELWYFQCKRYQTISSRALKDEVDKINALALSDPKKKCTGIVFITNARITARTRETVANYCNEFGYQCDFWARTELDMRVKRHWEIVEEFFSAGENLTAIAPKDEVQKYNLLVHGINHLPQDYALRIQNFFTEYLGTPRQPVPFGGRQADLAELNRWLDDPLEAPYLLLAAPAGRGKSALLAHWSKYLLGRKDIAVAFLPVSIRYRTNLASVVFASLASRLAELHGEKVFGGADTPAEVWRGQMSNYLARPLPDGRRLLLILDGIDEAADWEAGPDLFPLVTPKGLRIVVSARHLADDSNTQNWLSRLGWEENGLALARGLVPLDPVGIADVLQRMGVPLNHLGDRVDIITELHRLSEGDPLLIRLYVSDLWTRKKDVVHLQPEDLRTIRPGLEGYFKRWWNEQKRLWGNHAPLREPAVETVLNILSCALGPLMREDIQRLAASKMELSSWMLDQTMSHLARFIIGDGRYQGYAFSHPRLADFFYEHLSAHEQQTENGRFLDWGKETLASIKEEKLQPEKTSPYIVQYYGAHLSRARAGLNSLLSLIDGGWCRAWEKLEGTYAGFLNDVNRAWQAARQHNQARLNAGLTATHLGAEIRCALCHASVNSLASNIPPELMGALVKAQLWTITQGLVYANRVPDVNQRVLALINLHSIAPENLKSAIIQQCIDAIKQIKEDKKKLPALLLVAPYLNKATFGQALAEVEGIEEKFYKSEALIALIPHLPQNLRTDSLQQALKVASQVETTLDALADELRLFSAGESLAESSLVRLQSLQATRSLRTTTVNHSYYCGAVMRLASHMPKTLLVRAAEDLLDVQNGNLLVSIVKGLGRYLPERLLKKALTVSLTITEDDQRVEALAALAPYLSKFQLVEVLFISAQTIKDISQLSMALAKLIPFLSEDLKDDAIQLALVCAGIGCVDEVVRPDFPWTVHQAEGESEERFGGTFLIELFGETWLDELKADRDNDLLAFTRSRVREELELLQDVETPGRQEKSFVRAIGLEAFGGERFDSMEASRAVALAELAPHFSPSLRQKALELARRLVYGKNRALALKGIAISLSEPEREQILMEAVRAVFKIASGGDKAQALTDLAPYLSGSLMGIALNLTLMLQEELRAGMLNGLAPYLPESLKEQAYDSIESIHNENARAQALEGLAPFLPGHLLQQGLAAVQSMNDQGYRARALAVIAPHLPKQLLENALLNAKIIKDTDIFEITKNEIGPLFGGLLLQRLQSIGAVSNTKDTHSAEIEGLLMRFSESQWQFSLSMVDDQAEFSELVRGIAGHVPDSMKANLLRPALKVIQLMWYDEDRARALIDLAPLLPASLLDKALNETQWLRDHEYRAMALAGIGIQLQEPLRNDVLRQAVTDIEAVQQERYKVSILTSLAEYLTGPLLTDMLEIALRLREESCRADALAGMAPHLPVPLLKRALVATEKLREEERSKVLIALIPHLPEELLLKTLGDAHSFEDQFYKLKVLVELAQRFPEQSRDRLLQEMFAATLGIDDLSYRALALTNMIRCLPHDWARKAARRAMSLADSVENAHQYVEIVLGSAPCLTESMIDHVLIDTHAHLYGKAKMDILIGIAPYLVELQRDFALFIAETIRTEAYRMRVLVGLAPHMQTPRLQTKILKLVQSFESESCRAKGFAGIAPYLSVPLLKRALEATKELRDEELRSKALIALISYLPEDLLLKTLEDVRSIQTKYWSRNAQLKFVTQLKLLQPSLFYDVWRKTLDDLGSKTRGAWLPELSSIIPTVATLGGVEAVIEILQSLEEVRQWWP